MSLNGFSQNVIDSTSIRLKKPIARLVIKDLIKGDGVKKEIGLLGKKLNLLETKIVFKDSVILNLNNRVMNFESILSTKTNQIGIAQELSKRLQLDLKKQKVKTQIFKLGSGTLIVGGLILLLAK
jgi:hypothetical protein